MTLEGQEWPANSEAGGPRRYLVRTFGCQMNEHDSERLAGLLETEGMVATDSAEDADVVIFNTCCIRENADNRLYGNLGQLRALKQRRPGMQIAVGGCLAQKDREKIVERAPWVDAVFGTHNVGHAAGLLERAQEPTARSSKSSKRPPLRPTSSPRRSPYGGSCPFSAWVTIQVGCDNHCAFCIVPAVRGREISRPFAEVVAEVGQLADRGTVEVTLLGQNVNSYGRDLALKARNSSRLEGALAYEPGSEWASRRPPVRPARFSPTCSGPCPESTGSTRVRFTSPHPKDLRPETIDAMASEKAASAPTCTCRSSRAATGCWPGCAEATQRTLPGTIASGARRSADLAVTTDIIVGFPGEDEEDFERTLEVAAEAEYDSAYTFIFSPRPGTEAATRTEDFVPPDIAGERFERLRQRGRAQRALAPPGASGPYGGSTHRRPGQKRRDGRIFRAQPAKQARPRGGRRHASGDPRRGAGRASGPAFP